MLAAVPGLGAEDQSHRGAEKLLLRLPDIGRGYVIGDDSGCGGLGTENAPPSVAQLAITYYPVPGCSMIFERLWRARRTPAKGVRDVESDNLVFASSDGAVAAMRVARDLARYVLIYGEGLSLTAVRVALGDEVVLLTDRESAALVWRSGTVVSLLQVRGRTARLVKRVALALGRRQQERIREAHRPGARCERRPRGVPR